MLYFVPPFHVTFTAPPAEENRAPSGGHASARGVSTHGPKLQACGGDEQYGGG